MPRLYPADVLVTNVPTTEHARIIFKDGSGNRVASGHKARGFTRATVGVWPDRVTPGERLKLYLDSGIEKYVGDFITPSTRPVARQRWTTVNVRRLLPKSGYSGGGLVKRLPQMARRARVPVRRAMRTPMFRGFGQTEEIVEEAIEEQAANGQEPIWPKVAGVAAVGFLGLGLMYIATR